MRVALFGGSFDPIHRGHLAIATAAADIFALNSVLFAPVGLQPLKPGASHAGFADRLAMATLACTDSSDPRFTASTLDAPRPDALPNYTVDTLEALARDLPTAILFLLLGTDSFLDLRRWRSPDRILALAEPIVVSRPGYSLTEEDLAPLALTNAQRTRTNLLTGIHQDISATELRARLHAGDPCSGLLPAAVADYIQAHHLYR